MPPRGTVNVAGTWASISGQWQALTPGNRRGIMAAAAAVVAGVLLAAALGARGPAMAPLFTSLAAPDGAAIVAQLEHSKVPYRLTDNGQTILVPKTQVDKLRLQMAGQGLPKAGSVGLSSVLTLPFGATDFTRQVAYQDGLQGELEQTIDQIHGVEASRVQIVLPQQSTFSGGGSPASAAVLVELQPGASLTSSEVGGVAQLVAASVQGLSPDAVTVLDQNGQILWSQGGAAQGQVGAGGAAGQAQSQLQVQQQFDTTLQTQLQQLLDQVFGPGNVVTQVQAQLSFDSGTTDDKLFSPAGSSPAVVQSMQDLKQTVVGGGGSGAVPGTATNSFPTYPAGTGTSNTSSTSDQLTQNFDVSQQDSHTVVAPGKLSRLSVAVVVNTQLSAAQQALVRSTVEAAVGADPARKDQITVVGLPFNRSLLTTLQSPASKAARLPLPVPVLAAIGGVLLVLLLLLLVRRRSAPSPLVPEVPGGAGPTITPAVSMSVAGDEADGLAGALAGAQAARDRLHGSLKQRPEDVARVIRVWLDHAD